MRPEDPWTAAGSATVTIRLDPGLVFKPLTPSRIDDFAHVMGAGGSGRLATGSLFGGSGCWDLWPRLSGAEQRADGLDRSTEKRRAKLTTLAKRRHAPGLLAYRGREAVGWVSIGPRLDYHRLAQSKATPAVDELRVWVIPCLAVRRRSARSGRRDRAHPCGRGLRDLTRRACRRGVPARRCQAGHPRRVGVVRDRGPVQESRLQEGAGRPAGAERLDPPGHDARHLYDAANVMRWTARDGRA